MRRRVGAAISIAAAVVVFVAAGYVLFQKDPVKDAGQTPGFSLGTSGPASPVDGTASQLAAPGSKGLIAFLGDDYTAGAGATGSSKDFVTLVGSKLKAQVKDFSVTGGGYAKASNGNDYGDRVASIVAAKPAMVVVTGGRNDVSDDQSTLTGKAEDLFARLHKALPDAVLVAVAPFWGDSDAPSDLDKVATAVEKGVKDAKGTYLDLPDPLNGHPAYMANASNPNDRGYQAIADALAPKLQPLLPKS